jgi:hypothetical protein
MTDASIEEKPLSTAARLVEKNSPEQTVKDETQDESKVKSEDKTKDETNVKSETKSEKEIQDESSSVTSNQDDETDIEDSLVTEELAKVMGLPKGFIGQPLWQVGESYRNSLREQNNNNQELIQLRTSLDELKQQVTQTQVKKSEEDANKEMVDKIGVPPNPFDEPDGFAKWLEKRDTLIETKLTKIIEKKTGELEKSFNENPDLKQARQLALKSTEKNIISIIKDGLPDDKKADASGVLDQWLKDNEEDYEAMVQSGLYKAKPERLAKDVLTWFKAQSFDDLKSKKDSDIIKEVHKKTKQNIKEMSKVKQQEENRKDRNEPDKPDTTASRILEKLLKQQGISA